MPQPVADIQAAVLGEDYIPGGAANEKVSAALPFMILSQMVAART
jgi:hypothetical protein